MKKVYVLKIDVSVDYEEYSETKVFDNYNKAMEAFDYEVDEAKRLIGPNWDVYSDDDETFEATDMDDNSNHIQIRVLVKDLL